MEGDVPSKGAPDFQNRISMYTKINLDDYNQSGAGSTAITYDSKDGRTLAKLFTKGLDAETSEHEFHMCQFVYEAGIPTPRPIRLVTDGERYGAEYERIPGKRSYARIISQEPDKMVPLTEKFAALARRIHDTPADTTRLPEMKETAKEWILRYESLPQTYKDRFVQFLDTVPSPPFCLHGDLHFGNIISDGKKDLWIDVGDFSYGVPEWDLGLMFFAMNVLTREKADELFHLEPATLQRHWQLFTRAYWNTDSQGEIDDHVRRVYPFAAAKFTFMCSKLTNGKGPLKESTRQLIDRFLIF